VLDTESIFCSYSPTCHSWLLSTLSKRHYSKNKNKLPPLLLLLLDPTTRLPPVLTIATPWSTSVYPVLNAAIDWDGVSSAVKSQGSTRGSCAKRKGEFLLLLSHAPSSMLKLTSAFSHAVTLETASSPFKRNPLVLSTQSSTSISRIHTLPRNTPFISDSITTNQLASTNPRSKFSKLLKA